MNKSQAEKKVCALHAVFRADVNDVKTFQNPTKTFPFDHVLKQLNFDLLIPTPRVVGGSAGKIFATMLLHFVIPFNLICNMTML